MSGFTNLVSDLRAFRDNDSDRDARLTREEVSQALEMLGVEHQKEGLETMLTKAKLGQFLDMAEFVRVVKALADDQSMRRQKGGSASALVVGPTDILGIMGDEKKRLLSA